MSGENFVKKFVASPTLPLRHILQPLNAKAGPLRSVRVIDLTQHLSGPFCTWTLGALGADVIKIESIDVGDGARGTPPFVNDRGLYFDSLNRDKRSVALNLKTPEAREILHRMLRGADVLVENFRPGVRNRLGCSDDVLKKINPDLFVCSISGFGQNSSYADHQSYDIIAQAMSGMMSINGPVGSSGMRVGFSIGDIAAGMFAAIGVISRLYDRAANKSSGLPPLDISMIACQLAMLENAYARSLNTEDNPAPLGSRHPSVAPFECYSASDADLVIGLNSNSDWPKFCEAIEAPVLAENQRFGTSALRLIHRDELEKHINEALGKKPRRYWLDRLRHANIPSGPKVSVREFGAEPFAAEIRAFEEINADGHDFRYVRHPLKPADADVKPAPLLGEHTVECLQALGYSASQIGEFRDQSIVSYPA